MSTTPPVLPPLPLLTSTSTTTTTTTTTASSLDFNPALFNFSDDGKITGIDPARAGSLDEQQTRLNALKEKIEADERRLAELRRREAEVLRVEQERRAQAERAGGGEKV